MPSYRSWLRLPPVKAGAAGAALATGRLDGLAAASADDAWAVGTTYPGPVGLGRRAASELYGTWNGRGWALRTGPHITQLNAVSFDGRSATWAVGSESTSDQAFRPVVEVSG